MIQSFNNEKKKFINNVTDLTNEVERYRKEIENSIKKFNISEVKTKNKYVFMIIEIFFFNRKSLKIKMN